MKKRKIIWDELATFCLMLDREMMPRSPVRYQLAHLPPEVRVGKSSVPSKENWERGRGIGSISWSERTKSEHPPPHSTPRVAMCSKGWFDFFIYRSVQKFQLYEYSKSFSLWIQRYLYLCKRGCSTTLQVLPKRSLDINFGNLSASAAAKQNLERNILEMLLLRALFQREIWTKKIPKKTRAIHGGARRTWILRIDFLKNAVDTQKGEIK